MVTKNQFNGKLLRTGACWVHAQQTARLWRVLSFLKGAPNESNPATHSLAVHSGRPSTSLSSSLSLPPRCCRVAPARRSPPRRSTSTLEESKNASPRFRQGTILDFEFRDSSQTFGSLGPLSAASFQFTDSDSNKTQTHFYSDLVEVKKAREYIGDGSVHHHVRLLVPIIIGAGVAAAGIAAYEVLH